jgi:hypothetical protein
MASAGLSAFDDANGNAGDIKTKNAKHALQKYLGIDDNTSNEDKEDIKCKTLGHLLQPFGHLQAKYFITLPERYHLPDFGLQ